MLQQNEKSTQKDFLVMVANIMIAMLQMMLANVDAMVQDVMTTQGVCYLGDVKANHGFCNYRISTYVLG